MSRFGMMVCWLLATSTVLAQEQADPVQIQNRNSENNLQNNEAGESRDLQQITEQSDPVPSSAQAADQSTEPPAPSAARPIEEIRVTGRQTLLSLKNQLVRAEDSLYKMFNDLNSSDNFDIYCHSDRSVNSYIPRRRCDPVFFTQLKRNSAQHAMAEMRQAWAGGMVDTTILNNAMDYLESDDELRQQSAGNFEDLNQEIFRIASENPEYLRALENIAAMKENYEAERKKRFED